MSETPLIRLSQAQLNLLETCPPRFQQVFLEQLGNPFDPQQQERGIWGSRFHQLMQQQELNLPIAQIATEDEQLHQSIRALNWVMTQTLPHTEEIWREAEHCRTWQQDQYLFTVIYDLLIAGETQAQILDWKTYLQPENPQKLAKNWQTRLYLYILAETSDYTPEQISMTYWFVKLPTEPQKITFPYDQARHQATHQDLQHLLQQLTQWQDAYQKTGQSFPHFPHCDSKCPFAQYFSSAVAPAQASPADWQIDLETIEEFPL